MPNDEAPANPQSASTETGSSDVDLLMEVVKARESGPPVRPIDSRLRIGASRKDGRGSTRTDAAFIQYILRAIPEAQRPTFSNGTTTLPPHDDQHADVKRSLSYTAPTGISFASEGHLSKYLGGDEVTRIVDGSFRVYAIDQNGGAPKLSYLRLGKPEQQLTMEVNVNSPGASGEPVPKRYDRSRDTKYTSGVGVYTQGDIQVYSANKTAFRASGPFYINSRGYVLTSYGERRATSYDINSQADLNDINAGLIDDTSVDRTLINVDWRHKRADGWYTQVYDRGKRVDFYTSNKGEVGTSAKYALSMGLVFNHSISAGLDTGYAATVEVKGSSVVKVTSNGVSSETPFGTCSLSDSLSLTGNSSVEIGCADVATIALSGTTKVFANVMRAAVVAQNAAFLAYEVALAAKANMTLNASQLADDLHAEDAHGFETAFNAGPDIYNAAIGLSAITCAAGILLAAVQAAAMKVPPLGFTPKIEMDPFGMTLSCGPLSKIKLNVVGVEMDTLINRQKATLISLNGAITSFAP